jgi:hypothetical protein
MLPVPTRRYNAYCEPVTLVAPPYVQQPQVQETTPKFQDVIAAAKPNPSDAESRDFGEHLAEYGDIFVIDDDYGRTDKV